MSRRPARADPPAVETGVGRARVELDRRDPTVRRLLIDEEVHGAVDLADPARTTVDYQARLVELILALLHGRPAGLLVHLGGGAFAVPRAVAARLGTAAPAQLVVERSAAIIDLARRELGLRTGDGLAVRKGDARRALARLADGSAALVVNDVFVGQRTPDHLVTVEFLADAHRVLTPAGFYVANLVDEQPWTVLGAHAAAARTSFRLVFAVAVRGVARLRDPGNVLLVASDADIPLATLAHRLAVGAHPSAVIAPSRLAALQVRARLDADGPGR